MSCDGLWAWGGRERESQSGRVLAAPSRARLQGWISRREETREWQPLRSRWPCSEET